MDILWACPSCATVQAREQGDEPTTCFACGTTATGDDGDRFRRLGRVQQ